MYVCIDLKSFYASVECVDRGLDPMKVNLVVADPARGKGAICLAITPALKRLGVHNRCRLFEIPKNIGYITALPRMKKYMEISAQIYGIFLRFISPEDIHVYSVDESFIDVAPYLSLYSMKVRDFAKFLMQEIYRETGITATAGIGTNLFLAKVALDVLAKHAPDCVGALDENYFKQVIWYHQPITDIWQIGSGTAKRLAKLGIYDLHGITTLEEERLYKIFGINAELLIDHAWGRETCTMQDIHNFHSRKHSINSSQILFENYTFEEGLIPLEEMVDTLTLELIEKGLVTNSVGVTVGYADNRWDSVQPTRIPHTGGRRKLSEYTDSFSLLWQTIHEIYGDTTLPNEAIRRLGISFDNVVLKKGAPICENLFANSQIVQDDEKEFKIRQAINSIKHHYGRNALLRGLNMQIKSTGQIRNKLIGGHNGGET